MEMVFTYSIIPLPPKIDINHQFDIVSIERSLAMQIIHMRIYLQVLKSYNIPSLFPNSEYPVRNGFREQSEAN